MSFITKKHFPRGTFRQCAGVTLALPLIDAMLPASTALAYTAAGQPKSSLVGIFSPMAWRPGESSGPIRLPRDLPQHRGDKAVGLRVSVPPFQDLAELADFFPI